MLQLDLNPKMRVYSEYETTNFFYPKFTTMQPLWHVIVLFNECTQSSVESKICQIYD